MNDYHCDWIFSYKTFSKLRGRQSPLTLDIVCREGEKTKFIKLLTSTIIGLDLSAESVKREKAKGIKSVVGDAMNLPFRDESFDAVTEFHVMELTNNPQKFLIEAYRILRKEGFIILVTPNRKKITSKIYKFLSRSKN